MQIRGSLWLYCLLSLLLSCTPEPQGTGSHQLSRLGVALKREEPSTQGVTTMAPLWTAMHRMIQPRTTHTSTLLTTGEVLVVGMLEGQVPAEIYDPAQDLWFTTGAMQESRSYHSTTMLPNGKVLVVGGYENGSSCCPLDSAELYDPATRSWSSAGNLKTARAYHTATLLLSGKVLVVGGGGWFSDDLTSVEEYDPESNTWSSTPPPPLHQARAFHTATLLPDGRVLVLGSPRKNFSQPGYSLEIYDPKNRTWTSRWAPEPVIGHTSTLLSNGKILVAGGVRLRSDGVARASSLVDLYDPEADLWSSASRLIQAREQHSATLLSDGRVLVTGGETGNTGTEWFIDSTLDSTEVYDPVSNQWTLTPPLLVARFAHAATLLSTGKVLVTGGYGIYSPTASAETYDPTIYRSSSVPTAPHSYSYSSHTASLLPDGRVLLAGADGESNNRACSVYNPETKSWADTGWMLQDRSGHTATVLNDGKILAVGGARNWWSRLDAVDSVELYDPGTETWSHVSNLEPDRARHTATLLPDGKVLVVGGVQVIEWGSGYTERSLASAILYDPKTRQWSSAGSMLVARDSHSATLLPNGKVLVVGGDRNYSEMSLAELYDPATNSWSSGGTLATAYMGHTATLLRNGRVLVIGGADMDSGSPSLDMEEYDPATNRWSSARFATKRRMNHSTILLPNGNLLVVGGTEGAENDWAHAASEIYDPVTKKWFPLDIQLDSFSILIAPLPNGEMLILDGDRAMLFTTTLGISPLRPTLNGVSPSVLEPGELLTLTGTNFLGLSGGGGQSQSPSSNYPLLSLQSISSGDWRPLLAKHFSDTSITATLPNIPVGQYLLNVTTHALTASKLIHVTNAVPPKTELGFPRPNSLTQDTTAVLSFGSKDLDLASFECSLDDNPFSSCTSPKEYVSLRDGVHVFKARGRDVVGNVEPPSPGYSWTIDTTPPDVSIEDEQSLPPSGYSPDSKATLSFNSKAQDFDHFECKLDKQDFNACTSPQSYNLLGEGPHSFQVRVSDKAGNVAMSPLFSWTVDTVVPDPRPISGPPPFTTSDSAAFSFHEETGVTFECKIDSGVFSLCASGQPYTSLREGKHSFWVRATDLAGNSATSDPYEWTVVSAPAVEISGPLRFTHSKDSTIYFSSPEAGVHFECRLDHVEFTSCSSPQGYAALEDGDHTFEVRATDPAGNTGIRDYPWTVDTVSPEPPSLQLPVSRERVFTNKPVFSGTAEPWSTIQVFVDGALTATAKTEEAGSWQVSSSPLTWGTHSFTATATDRAGNISPSAPEGVFITEQHGYYNLGCGTSPAPLPAWPLALLALRVSRRQHRTLGQQRGQKEM